MIEEKKIVPQDKRWKEFFSLSRFRREDQFDSSRIDPSIVHGIVKAVQLARFERGEKVDGRRLIRLGNFRVVGLHFVSAAINPASWVSLSLSLSLVSAFAFTLNAISLSRPTTSSKIFLLVALRGSLFLPRFIQRDLPDNRISDSQNAIYYWALSIDFLRFLPSLE